ncbi:class I SAM-dependent methyltransferase [archaeon]|jgi:ubiquinone/menaquinone biosynthesis C-methylase UbiE|nr:class I SAM-dependent methyltransferase [archaeon]MBT7392505.1 class I SAM-dependent methyltransferase [archaeon]
MKKYQKVTVDTYDRTADEFTKKVESLHNIEQSKIFLNLIPKNCHILDLGCGSGRDSEIFSQKKYKVTGIDLSSKMINICKKRNIDVDFRIMNILDLKFEDESFDGIWANASFIHIPKNEFFKGLNESLRILKKDGVMYISLKLGNNEGIENDDRYGIANKYMSYFSKDEIEKDLIDSGFSIIQSEIEIKYDNYANHPWINIFVRK